jgi:hypothetical protein
LIGEITGTLDLDAINTIAGTEGSAATDPYRRMAYGFPSAIYLSSEQAINGRLPIDLWRGYAGPANELLGPSPSSRATGRRPGPDHRKDR